MVEDGGAPVARCTDDVATDMNGAGDALREYPPGVGTATADDGAAKAYASDRAVGGKKPTTLPATTDNAATYPNAANPIGGFNSPACRRISNATHKIAIDNELADANRADPTGVNGDDPAVR